jgi:hypothetical protein
MLHLHRGRLAPRLDMQRAAHFFQILTQRYLSTLSIYQAYRSASHGGAAIAALPPPQTTRLLRSPHLNPLSVLNGAEQRGLPRPQPPNLHNDIGELLVRPHHFGTAVVTGTLRYLQDLCRCARTGHPREMSTQVSLPRSMRQNLPENGYESPRSPDDDILFGQGILHSEERRRVGRTKSSDNHDEVESPESRAQYYGGMGTMQHKSDEEGGEKTKAGFRARVGCFTWTWFTMTMATGGIANVLHSSNAIHSSCQRSSALINCSSIPLRLVDHCWRHIFSLQRCIVCHKCNFDYFTVQMESRLFS